MSNEIEATVTKHVYIDKWAVKKSHNGGDLEAGDLSIMDSPEHGSDYLFYLCPIDVSVTIPTGEAAQLMELAGCEMALDVERKKSMARMHQLQCRIDELKALPVPEEPHDVPSMQEVLDSDIPFND